MNNRLNKILDIISSVISVGMCVYHLIYMIFIPMLPMPHRIIHLCFAVILILVFALREQPRPDIRGLYTFLMICNAAANIYMINRYPKVIVGFDDWLAADYLAVVVIIVTILIAAFYVAGLWLPAVVLIVIFGLHFYAYFPGTSSIYGLPWHRFMSSLLSGEGLYGNFLGAISTYVFALVIFSQACTKFGIAQYMVSLTEYISRKHKLSGAASTAIAGILYGLLTIRSRMNVIQIGSLTAHGMRKQGYDDAYSAGLVSAVATSGKLAPPVLGVTAAYIAVRLSMTYAHLCIILIPSILIVYICIFSKIFFENKINGLEEFIDRGEKCTSFRVLDGLEFLISLMVLIILSFTSSVTFSHAVLIATFVLFAAHYVTRALKHEFDFKSELLDIYDIAMDSCDLIVPMSITTACISIIVGCLYATGMNIRVIWLLLGLLQHSKILVVGLIILVTLWLGGRISGVAVYLGMSSIFVYALTSVGISEIAAHIMVFYYANIASLGPFGGDAISSAFNVFDSTKRDIRKEAIITALPMYLIPISFVFNPGLLLSGDVGNILLCFGVTLAVMLLIVYLSVKIRKE